MDKRAVLKALQAGEFSVEQARAAIGRMMADERRSTVVERAPAKTDIAIIGVSGRFPGAEDVDALWGCLAAGITSVSRAPTDRGWNIRDFFDPVPQTPGKTYVVKGAFLEAIDRFDPLFFGISPREAAFMDPAARLFLEESWRAIEDAGYAPGRISGRNWGVFSAVKGDYEMYIQREHETHFLGTEAFSAARLSYLLNLFGPAVAVDTACSSSLVAIAMACDSLVLGNCAVAVAGGASVFSTPATLITSSQSLLFSPDSRCYTFDDRANGTVLGEAVAAVVLKPLTRAEEDGDAIYGVIKGWGTNQDGRTNGITAPNMRSQARLQASIYRRFKIDPERITLLEAHGTGTKLGDPIEVQALTESFREFTKKTAFCSLGAIKPNIGHTFFAAGVVGVIKLVLCMKHGKIPPSINFASINENIALAESPFYVNTEIKHWDPGAGGRRCAAVNSFGLSGTNAHVVIEEYPKGASETASETGEAMVVPLSARDPERLHEYAERLVRFLERNGVTGGIREVAFTLQTGRTALEERLGVVVSSRRELLQTLEAFLRGELDDGGGSSRGRVARGNESDATLSERAEEAVAARDIVCVARVWTQGGDIAWQRLWQGERPAKVHLPTYPFARERHWLPVDGFRRRRGAGTETSRQAAVDLHALELSSTKRWLCVVERWTAGRADRPPTAVQEMRRRLPEPRVLVIGGDAGLQASACDGLVQALAESALLAARVERIDLAATDLDDWLRRNDLPHAMFFFVAGEEPIQRLSSVLACCRAVSWHCHQQPVDVFICFDEAGERLEAHDEALSGLLRSATAENAHHRYHWIRHAAGDPARGHDLAGEWLSLYGGTQATHPRPLVRYRGGLRSTTVYENLQSIPVTNTPRIFRPDGAYLVIGGLGEVGRRVISEIGKKYRPTLAIVSRRAPDADAARTLNELREAGAQVLWSSADVTDSAAMLSAFEGFKKEVPRFHGVLHLARSVADGLIVHKDTDGFARTIAAKVAGTEIVDMVTKDEPLDFFLMFSSMASFGLRGSSDYAHACAFQSAFARLRNRMRDRGDRSGDAISLCWGQWEVDRYVDPERRSTLKDLGFDLIDAPSALRVMEACMNGLDGALGFVAVTDKERARSALAGSAAPSRIGEPPPRPVAADARLLGIRKALEALSYEGLMELHSAAVSAQAGWSER